MRRLRLLSAILAALSIGTACASTGSGGSSSGNRNVLTQEQIIETSSGSMYDVISRLRPDWLRVRGASSTNAPAQIQVIRDGVRVGDISFLQTMSIEDVKEARYINSRDATTRWGTGYSAGAIEVITR